MKDHVELVKEIRAIKTPHYNCCQAVMGAFAEEMSMSQEQIMALGAHFGAGMGCGSTCGAVNAALMVMGMADRPKGESGAFLKRFQEEQGALDCKTLRALGKEQGLTPGDHCNHLIFEAVRYMDEGQGN